MPGIEIDDQAFSLLYHIVKECELRHDVHIKFLWQMLCTLIVYANLDACANKLHSVSAHCDCKCGAFARNLQVNAG